MGRRGPQPELPHLRARSIELVHAGKSHREVAAELGVPPEKVKAWCGGIVRQSPEAIARTQRGARTGVRPEAPPKPEKTCRCGEGISSRSKFCNTCRGHNEMKTKAQWGVCRHCGRSNDVLVRRSGDPGRICRACHNARRASENSRPMPTTPAPAPRRPVQNFPRLTVEERRDRIQIALEIANAEGISLVHALALEGVI